MRSTFALVLLLCGLGLAQGPVPGGGTPPPGGATPPAPLDPNLGWYRLTYQRQAVGFAREEWKEEQYSGKNCLHLSVEGQFVAKPDLLRDLPFTDYKYEVICDAQTQDLQWATYALSFPVQLAPGAGSSDFKLVQGLVRFMIDRRTEEAKSYLRFTSSDEEFQDAQLMLGPGDEFVFPDAIPRSLTGQMRAGKSFEKRSILLTPGLGSGRDAAKYIATIAVSVKEKATVKVGDAELSLWPVLVSNTSVEGVTATRVSLLDDKGVIRRSWLTYLDPSKIQFGEEPQDTIIYTRVESEMEAREGLAFVLSSKGRRDPFIDPRTPSIKDPKGGKLKDIPSGAGSTGPVTPVGPVVPTTSLLKLEDAQEFVREADRLRADIEKIINLADKATPAQNADRAKFEARVYEINTQVQATKFVALKAQMTDVMMQLDKLAKVKGDRYVVEARAVAKRIEEIFKNEELAPPIRVSEIGKQIEDLKRISVNPSLRAPDQAEVTRFLQDGDRFHRRAKVRAEFEIKKPDITGIVVASESITAPLKVGLVLFGRPIVIDAEIPLPKSKSSVILNVKGSKSGHRTYEEGQSIEGAGNMKVKRIERNKVIFEYEQELISVSTTR
ncbi:MAG: hypothetical protein AAB434_11740 [Planctomycetota bacterium]